jgi:hypothetical protein
MPVTSARRVRRVRQLRGETDDVPPPVSDACLTVERDLAAAWWLLAEAGGYELHDEAGLRWFHTGLPDPHLNPVLATRLAPDGADAVIDRMVAELTDRGAPFMWWVTPSSSPDDLAARLVSRGFVADEPWPGMTVEADAMREPPPVSGLAIRRVTNDVELETYVRIFAPILSPSSAFTALLAEASRRIGYAEDAPEVHFVGLLEGAPVSTASLITRRRRRGHLQRGDRRARPRAWDRGGNDGGSSRGGSPARHGHGGTPGVDNGPLRLRGARLSARVRPRTLSVSYG